MIDELVRRAVTTGLRATCQFAGSFDDLTPAASQAAYRVVQEALTNALKHAPGASVTVTVRTEGAGGYGHCCRCVPSRALTSSSSRFLNYP
jgi:signal transduction histidine kinase